METWHLVIERIVSWPVFTFVAFLLILKPLKDFFAKTGSLKMGNFQLSVQEIAKSLGISDIIGDIKGLSYDELKLFLIICGEDADFYQFSPKNIPPQKFESIVKTFSKKGLIKQINPESIEGINLAEKTKPVGFKTTQKGQKAHRAIVDSIFSELLSSRKGEGDDL